MKLIIVGPPLPSLSQRITEMTGRQLPLATRNTGPAPPALGSVNRQQATSTMVGPAVAPVTAQRFLLRIRLC